MLFKGGTKAASEGKPLNFSQVCTTLCNVLALTKYIQAPHSNIQEGDSTISVLSNSVLRHDHEGRQVNPHYL